MADRQIDTVFDLTEEDVDAIYHTLQLTRALIDYSEESDSDTFDNTTMLRRYEQQTAMMWQAVAVAVANAQDRSVSPRDLMEERVEEFDDG